MVPVDEKNITLDELRLSEFGSSPLTVDVLRLDKIHPEISGNKWYKLKFYLEEAFAAKKTIVTFGGAWSNHILAVAAACKFYNIPSIGIIRGEQPVHLSYTLHRARLHGMKLHFINRDQYRDGNVPVEFGTTSHYIIPAGGFGIKGAEGASSIRDLVDVNNYSAVMCAVGTGTMLAGLVARSSITSFIGINVLKNNFSALADVMSLLPPGTESPNINNDYHFGGYAKFNTELISFMNSCFRQSGIPTDFVYTAKLFYAVSDMIRQGMFASDSRILLIHSGGLQGNLSLSKGTLIF